MGDNIVIFGAGSFAELAHFYFTNDSDDEVIAFTAHENYINTTELKGLSVVPFEEITSEFPPGSCKMFVAVGYRGVNRMRAAIYEEVKNKGYKLSTYISSKCTYWGESIGENCFIFEDNTIQPFVTIGNNVVIWSGNHIGHHSSIGDHCFISSHVVISGHVNVSPYCFFGVNSTVRDNIGIGEACVIGAGALIMKSTRAKEVYVSRRTLPDSRTSERIKI